MPLRVKCRCGQELVVRYSEWVYVFLGIALLSLILNTVVVVLFYFRLESVSTAGVREAPGAQVASQASATPGGTKAPNPAAKAPVAAENPLPTPPNGAPLPAAPSSPAGDTAAPAKDALHSIQPTVDHEPLADILFQARRPWELALGSSVADRSTEKLSRRTDEGSVSVLDSGSAARSPHLEPLAEGGPLARLLLLERSRADSLFSLALLLDPDPVVRRRAIARLLADKTFLASGATSGDARALLAAAVPALCTSAPGRALLAALDIPGGVRGDEAGGSSPPWGPLVATRVAGLLDALREKAVHELSDAPAVALQRHLGSAAGSGVDLVLAVDVSQSMEGALEQLQHEATWLLPALTWALPGVRVGLILYRDGVETELDFSLAPSGDILRAIREARAEGGGDVPEGVHEALKAALSLGRLRWQESADKHIVLVGDGPPPYAQAAGLLSVVRQAFRQGGYRVHALGVRPEEGRPAVPFFPEIAKAGGGLASTVLDPSRCGAEIFLCLFPSESRAAVEVLLPAVKELFAPNG